MGMDPSRGVVSQPRLSDGMPVSSALRSQPIVNVTDVSRLARL